MKRSITAVAFAAVIALPGCATGPCDSDCQARQAAALQWLATRPPPAPLTVTPMPVNRSVNTTCTTYGNTTNCTTR